MQILIRAITAKQAAQVISVVTAAILILRVYLTTVEFGSIFSALSYLSQFFTILTNILVMLTMFVIGLGRKIPRPGTELVLVALFIVFIRPAIQALDVALVNNAIMPNFGTLIRWRAHRQAACAASTPQQPQQPRRTALRGQR